MIYPIQTELILHPSLFCSERRLTLSHQAESILYLSSSLPLILLTTFLNNCVFSPFWYHRKPSSTLQATAFAFLCNGLRWRVGAWFHSSFLKRSVSFNVKRLAAYRPPIDFSLLPPLVHIFIIGPLTFLSHSIDSSRFRVFCCAQNFKVELMMVELKKITGDDDRVEKI